MPRSRYSTEVDDAIFALHCANVGVTEIIRRLKANEAGLGVPVEIPRSTVYRRLKRLRRERKAIPGDKVATVDELEKLGRHGLELAARDVIRKIGTKTLTAGEVRVLEAAAHASGAKRQHARGPGKEKAGPESRALRAYAAAQVSEGRETDPFPLPDEGAVDVASNGASVATDHDE